MKEDYVLKFAVITMTFVYPVAQHIETYRRYYVYLQQTQVCDQLKLSKEVYGLEYALGS